MAYRRKHSMTRSTTFEDHKLFSDELPPSPTVSLAAQAIRASAAHRDSSLSSAYGDQVAYSASSRDHLRTDHPKDTYECTSTKNLHEPKSGFWGVLARKAKSILEDANGTQQPEDYNNQFKSFDSTGQLQSHWLTDSYQKKTQNQMNYKGSDVIASSLREFGGTIRKSFEEGLTIVENRTNDIIQETKKLQNRRKYESPDASYQTMDALAPTNVSLIQAEYESQLKASRDVANAMAAKAKLLLRELKTLKADLAFVKERSTQLEEENKILRENRQKGNNSADDDMIRLQLETLLAEKSRLAHENSIYARENRFLREVVEYHQLTMQDVVYLDEGNEEIAEVDPIHQFSTFSSPARSESDVLSPVIPCSRSTTPNRWLSPSPSALILSASPTSRYSPPRNKALSVAFGTGLSPPSPKARSPIQRCSSTPSS